jgi:hypothetical protein
MFLVECCFYCGNTGFNFMCTSYANYHTTKQLKYFTFYSCFFNLFYYAVWMITIILSLPWGFPHPFSLLIIALSYCTLYVCVYIYIYTSFLFHELLSASYYLISSHSALLNFSLFPLHLALLMCFSFLLVF